MLRGRSGFWVWEATKDGGAVCEISHQVDTALVRSDSHGHASRCLFFGYGAVLLRCTSVFIAGLAYQHARQEEEDAADSPLQAWEEFGHRFEPAELARLKNSIVEMALNRIEGQDELFVGG